MQIAALGVQPPGGSWAVRLTPSLSFDVELPPWSFRDVGVQATRRLPGTVRLEHRVLRNETGDAFTQALFVEPGAVYVLGALPAGGAVDLAGARREPLAQYTGRGWPFPHRLSQDAGDRQEDQPRGAFVLAELIRGWRADGGRAFEPRRGVFLGLSAAGALGGDVAGVPTTRAQHVITVISVTRP